MSGTTASQGSPEFGNLRPDDVWQSVIATLDRDPSQTINTFWECCGRWSGHEDKLALLIRDPDGSAQRWTYADLSREAARASRMFHKSGLRRGDRLVAILGRQVEAWICALAAWRAGLVYVPVFPGFGHDAMAYRIGTSDAKAVVVDYRSVSALDQARALVPKDLDVLCVAGPQGTGLSEGARSFWSEMELCAPDGPEIATAGSDPASLMFTSGTTGQPKACIIPHEGFLSLFPFVKHAMAISPTDFLFSTSDPSWSYGLYTTGCVPMALGIPRVIYSGDFDARAWIRLMEEEEVTHAAGAPTAFRRLTREGLDHGFNSSLRAASTAGEPLDADTVEDWAALTGSPMRDSYGLTEVGMLLANLGDPMTKIIPGALGAAVPGFDVVLVDEAGEPLGLDAMGRIAVHRPMFQLANGYENAPEAWTSRWIGDLYMTDDLAYRDAEGWWWYRGRADDVIVTAGYNVGPGEVEAAILAVPGVEDGAAVAVPDADRGSVVCAVVVLEKGQDREAIIPAIQEAVRTQVGRHAYPRRFWFVDALPRTETGKVRRAALRSRWYGDDARSIPP